MNPEQVPVAEGTLEVRPASVPRRNLPQHIAPVWHTVLLAVLFLLLSLGGADSQRPYAEQHGRISLYLITLVAEWVAVAYVFWGIRKRGVTLRELTGGRWAQPEDALLDIALAVGFWIVAVSVLAMMAIVVSVATGTPVAPGASSPAKLAETCTELKRTVGFLAPDGWNEILVFLALSATAGFCEEIIFRGYFQRQFVAWSGLTLVGVLGQAVLFGASHGYQGTTRMVFIGVYALLFGALAWWRRSLRPGMIAHAMHDGCAGLLIRPIMRLLKC